MLIVPLEAVRAETLVVNSRFIASLAPADSMEAARDFLSSVRAEFSDARHHVPAFLVGGERSSTEYCSDDGEPSGTAGRPLLAVLRGSGLRNVAVVVTRYFGGTLLGTGGLVRAYSEAGRLALERVRRAALVEVGRLELDLPYPLFERFRAFAAASGYSVVNESFEEVIHLAVEVPLEGRAAFESGLADLSSGLARPRLVSSGVARRPL
jgi:uncharacterized YigZ family protein